MKKSTVTSEFNKQLHRENEGRRAVPLNIDSVHPNVTETFRSELVERLPFSPVFTPSSKQFEDPLRYIDSLKAVGEAFGIIKIIPPQNWKPSFAIDTENFWFQTRIQKLNSMEGSTRIQLNYIDQLQKFHLQQGTPFNRIPHIDKKPVDLLQLKKEVAKRGGVDAVSEAKAWAEIGKFMGLYSKTSTSLSNSIKQAYTRYIQPYEVHLASSLDMNDIFENPSATTSDNESTAVEPSSSSSSKPKRSSKRIPNKSPMSKVAKGSVKEGEEKCEICHSNENPTKMLLCDECNRGHHLYCLSPPLTAVPKCDWFCPRCLIQTGNEFGFEEGETHCLSEFQKNCTDFKKNWFLNRGFPKDKDGNIKITEDDVEKEFWRLIQSPFDDVDTEYGADLHSSSHGSGFPTIEKQPLDSYSSCPWNLNNMPVLPKSLFSNIRNDISGMMVPWLYVGKCFSTFCWHTEDHYSYSINYLHWGETKTWYGIPADNAEAFEQAMRNKVPELFEANPDLLFHLTTMLSPATLVKDGIKVSTVDQREGEFVITFPKAYHAGFNHGFNFAEAVNFALPSWLPYGRNCMELYSKYKKMPVFSHDELVISTLEKSLDIHTASLLKTELQIMHERETAGLTALREHYGDDLVVRVDPFVKDQPNATFSYGELSFPQCSFCNCFLWLSGVYCKNCDKDAYVCFNHAAELRCCANPGPSLRINVTCDSLNEMIGRCINEENKILDWKQDYWSLFQVNERPLLSDIRKIFYRAVELSYHGEEILSLKKFIKRVDEWISAYKKVLAVTKKKRGPKEKKPIAGVIILAVPNTIHGYAIDKSLENYIKLVHEAEKMAFSCPELDSLKQTIADIHSFKERASNKLEILAYDYPQTSIAASEVLNELGILVQHGKSFDVDIDEIHVVESKLKGLNWMVNAGAILNSNAASDCPEHTPALPDYSTLVFWIDKGRNAGVRGENPVMAELLRLKALGDDWKVEASSLLKRKPYSLSDITKLLESGVKVPAPDLLKKVKDVARKAEDWRNRFKLTFGIINPSEAVNPETIADTDIIMEEANPISTSSSTNPGNLITETITEANPINPPPISQENPITQHTPQRHISPPPKLFNPNVKQAFDYTLVANFLDEITQISVTELEEIEYLNAWLEEVEEWRVRAKRILSPTSQSSLNDIVKELLAVVKACTSADKGGEADGNDDEKYCICHRKDSVGFMIECDVCKVWYHGSCLNITEQEADDRFVCLVCDVKTPVDRPKSFDISTLETVVADASSIICIPDEKKMILEIFEMLLNWKRMVDVVMKELGSITEELIPEYEKKLKNILRSIEGLPFAYEEEREKLRVIIGLWYPVPAPLVDGGDSSLLCICRRPYVEGVVMVCCDNCEEWFHLSCMGIDEREIKSLKHYQCPKCLKNKKKTSTKRKRHRDPGDELPVIKKIVLKL